MVERVVYGFCTRKKEVLKKLMLQKGEQASGILKEIHAILLRDTSDGKLYKYRSFDEKGYSLENLRNGTMHCSKPSVFNDPFEFKFGISLSELLEVLYAVEFKVVEGILEKLVELIRGNMELDECSDDEQRIINSVLEHQNIVESFMKYYIAVATEDDSLNVLSKSAWMIPELMQIIVEDDMFSDGMRYIAKMLPRVIGDGTVEEMRLLIGDDATIEDYADYHGITGDFDELELTKRIGVKLYPKSSKQAEDMSHRFDELEQGLYEEMNNCFFVGCLCTSYKNPLMWSHYADSHKGYCIEYDYSEIDGNMVSVMPLPVIYSENRLSVPWGATFGNDANKFEEASTVMLLAMLTKSSEWSYENEWRVLSNVNESPDIKMPKVSCIYLGVSISDEHRAEVLKIAEELHIPVKQMVLDRVKYALRTKDVSC